MKVIISDCETPNIITLTVQGRFLFFFSFYLTSLVTEAKEKRRRKNEKEKEKEYTKERRKFEGNTSRIDIEALKKFCVINTSEQIGR